MTTATTTRIRNFIGEFIQSEFLQAWESEHDADFINEPERAGRIADGGSLTHRERIEDWRRGFEVWLHDRRRGRWSDCDRFSAAVEAHFDAVEAHFIAAGTIDEEGLG